MGVITFIDLRHTVFNCNVSILFRAYSMFSAVCKMSILWLRVVTYYLCDNRIVNFCAKALHNEVLPVPGGPKKPENL